LANQFFLIVKNIDDGKFNWFKNKKFNKSAKEILDNNNSNYVWGIHKGIINDKIWNKIKKNDKIYFTIGQESFKISGIVFKKIKNLKYGKLIYPEFIDNLQINYFLFFEKLDVCAVSYHELIHNSKLPKRIHQGIFEINKEYFSEKIKKSIPKKLPYEITVGKAKKRRTNIEGFVRNSKVKNLKKLYDNQCQILQCNFKLKYVNKNNKKSSYSEVHHYNPLNNEGDDDYDNMIVLCPNHHSEFDFRVKFIHSDGTTIIDRQGIETGETIKFSKNHKLSKKNILSQLEL